MAYVKSRSKAKTFDLTAVVAAVAGGFVSDKLDDVLVNNVDTMAKNPGLSSGAIAAASLAALYFAGNNSVIAGAAYGSLGVAGAKIGDVLIPMNGFNRMKFTNTRRLPVNGFNRVWHNNSDPNKIGWSHSQQPYQRNVAKELNLLSTDRADNM